MQIFADFRINVTSGELGGDSGDKVYLSAPSMLTTQYQAIEKSLARVPGVRRVRRIALIPSERRHFELDILLRHVASPVLSVDREGRVVAANLAAARAFGVNLDRVPGLQLQRFLPLLQVAELLRDFAVPRYGMPVEVRGRSYQLEWSPIALAEVPASAAEGAGAVESLAGAVLTLEPREVAGSLSEPPPVAALWDFDLRRESCLQLQEMAAFGAPLLIRGEQGSGKSTFAAAVHYLSPLAAGGDCYRLQPTGDGSELSLPAHWPQRGTLVIEDLQCLDDGAQRALAVALQSLPPGLRAVATAAQRASLVPALLQVFSTLVLNLPPLRAMRPALGRFAGALLRSECGDSAAPALAADALAQMERHDWPDNFAGLRDYLLAARQRCRRRGSESIEPLDLPELDARALPPWQAWSRGLDYRQIMARVERALLQELLAECHSTRELAKRLGISHTAVANKLRRHGLTTTAP
ncbi:TyrR/PhhR family helix-turn-helix DNA-binding protein [Microbulbifer sp. SAOS-129_SWC]|uniref:TyrR/PhhR family helix-turn-helix DNA-binding protein n=1 Tax=Microbulbifer sp. SAOS-129_SWC TaxID=3145235 RepID=UPI0032167517